MKFRIISFIVILLFSYRLEAQMFNADWSKGACEKVADSKEELIKILESMRGVDFSEKKGECGKVLHIQFPDTIRRSNGTHMRKFNFVFGSLKECQCSMDAMAPFFEK